MTRDPIRVALGIFFAVHVAGAQEQEPLPDLPPSAAEPPAPDSAPEPPPAPPAEPAPEPPKPAPTPEPAPGPASFGEPAPAPAPSASGAAATKAAPTPKPASSAQQAPTAPPPARAMPAATAARPAEANPPAETESRHNEGDGLFGPIRIGPMVGVGLPHALSFGGTIKLTRYLGGGINVGLIPNSHISFYGKATLSSQEYDIYGRIYPFGGGFFLGAGVGYETVRGTLASSIDGSDIAKMYPQLNLPSSLEYASSGSVRTMVLTPQIGYFQSLGAGFHLGIDFGAQIPIAPSEITFERQANVPKEYEGALEPIDVEVRHSLEIIGQTTIPTVNLKLAWLL